MTRVIFAEGCREIDSPVTGNRYYAGHRDFDTRGYLQGGSFDVDDRDVKLVVKMGGAVASLASASTSAVGWRCPACGFGSWIKTCSRCGGECVREAAR